MIDGDAPQIEEAEGIRAGVGRRSVMEVVAVLVEEVAKTIVVGTAILREQRGACLGNINTAARVLVGETLAGGAVVGAEPGVGRDGRAVGVKGENVGGQGAGILVARIAMDAVEHRIEIAIAQPGEVGEHGVDGDASGGRKREREQARFVEG